LIAVMAGLPEVFRPSGTRLRALRRRRSQNAECGYALLTAWEGVAGV